MFEKEKEVVFYTLKEALRKSKIVITQYITIGSGFLQTFGDQILDTFNANSSQIQSAVDSKIFALISIICGILTIYLKMTSKSLISKKEDNNG